MTTDDAPVSELLQICQQPLNDGTHVGALPCIHSFHECCLTEYALADNQEKSALPCPVCRPVEPAVVDAADTIPSIVAVAELEVAESPVAEPAVASAEPEVAEPVVANTGKRGGKAKAKDRGKAKANAESEVRSQKPRKGNGKGKTAKAKAQARAKAQLEATAAEATAAEATSPEADAMVEDTLMEADEFPDLAQFTQCHLCGKDGVEKKRWNCLSIRRDEWKCPECNVSRVIFYNNGCYPPRSWQSDKERHSFWRQAQDLDKDGKLSLARLYDSLRRQVKTQSTTYMEGGNFWPLSYWKTKGLNTERIAKFSPPECIREDPVLGTCYKVVIVSESNKRKFDKVMQDTTTLTPEGQVSSTAASSSGEGAGLAGLTISELIAREKLQKEQEKQALRQRNKMVAKATKPADAILKVLWEIKAHLNVDKLPLALAAANPLESAIATVTDALATFTSNTYSNENVKELHSEVMKAKCVAKSMRVFI